MTRRPVPLSRAKDTEIDGVVALCFDLDDTFTTGGRVHPEAFAALWKAHEAGLQTVLVTGRPAGWCDHLCRMWPLDGVVGENGAFYFAYDPERRRVRRRYARSAARRAADRRRLATISRRILEAVPTARVAADQPFRETDLAIDFAEDVGPLGDGEVARIVEIFEKGGATAHVSSIHVNGYIGHYDKASMLLRFASECLGLRDAEEARARVAYVGDSPNDAPLFAAFEQTFGVANLERFLPDLAAAPRFITSKASGAGFAQVVQRLVRVRSRAGRAPRQTGR